VEKLKYVSIVGPVGQFDKFVLKHVIDKDIQLEHALTYMRNIRGLKPFTDENPYESLMKKVEDINKYINVRVNACNMDELNMLAEQAVEPEKIAGYLDSLEQRFIRYKTESENIREKINENRQILKQLIPIRNLQFDINEFFNLEYMKFRFGKMPRESYKKMDILLENLDIVVVPFAGDDNDIWVSYFVPSVNVEKTDSVMFSLYFERMRLPKRAKGFPGKAIQSFEQEIEQLEHEIRGNEKACEELIYNEKEKFQKIYNHIVYMYRAFDVRKFSAHTNQTFFVTGWMTKNAYKQLEGELKENDEFTVSVEDPDKVRGIKPPTILRNNWFFKPFESIVTMYGIPAHNEFDPTVLVTVTYILMFGTMFGDVGQGAVLKILFRLGSCMCRDIFRYFRFSLRQYFWNRGYCWRFMESPNGEYGAIIDYINCVWSGNYIIINYHQYYKQYKGERLWAPVFRQKWACRAGFLRRGFRSGCL